MKHSRRMTIALHFAACCLILPSSFQPMAAQQSSATTMAALRAGFASPPPAARLRCYWWWLNGHTDKATITHDLEEMRAKGFGGALLVDANGADQAGNGSVPAGPTFGSPAWVDLYTHALREADRLGLEITLNITSGWNLGGPDVTPEQASKLLTWSRTEITGGKHLALQLPAPGAKNGFYRPIAVFAYPLHNGSALPPQLSEPSLAMKSAAVETGFSMPDSTAMLSSTEVTLADTSLTEVRDLSSQLRSDGTLDWNAPPGEWEVLRIGYTDSDARVSTASGTWQGLAIDYLDRDAFNSYWDQTVEPLLTAAKPFHSLKYLATDSWEINGTNWTGNFAAEFKARRGYDPLPWLPVVAGRIVGDSDCSTRFLTDLRRTVADLVSANHYDLFAERAAAHGLGVQAESGGPHGAPIDALETFRHAAVPQSEFWSQNPHRATDQDRFFTKEAASAANIYGKRIVDQEGETSIGPQWSESLATDLKPSFDMAVTEGMNRLVWHEFTSSPAATGLPGQEYFAGTHLNPKVTWWDAGTAFFTYLNRIQFIMQQGTPVDDVLYFAGDNVPSFVRLKADDPAHVLPGYDYDVTDEDALLHTIHAEGEKLLGPSGVSWLALAMPESGRLSLPALEKIDDFVREGVPLIGLAPTSPTGMVPAADSARFREIVLAIWGACQPGTHHAYGKGEVYCTRNAREALAAMRIAPAVSLAATPDLLGATSTSALDYIHRRDGAVDIYFLRNGSDRTVSVPVLFRTEFRAAELWDAVTGEIRSVKTTGSDGRAQLTISLPPFGSIFVIFTDNAPSASPVFQTQRHLPFTPLHHWSVTFQANRGAPSQPTQSDTLESWTASPDPGIRYFSGTATYRAEVQAPASGSRISLRFSDLHEIARVRINGHDAGTVWAYPLELRVDTWLKPGINAIEIEVTNFWPNRIIGDLQPGTTSRITQTNITSYTKDSPLVPSGLIGPVEWLIEP